MTKMKLAILTFLYCGEFVKNSSVEFQYVKSQRSTTFSVKQLNTNEVQVLE